MKLEPTYSVLSHFKKHLNIYASVVSVLYFPFGKRVKRSKEQQLIACLHVRVNM